MLPARTRTHNPLLTKEPLYLLSYGSETVRVTGSRVRQILRPVSSCDLGTIRFGRALRSLWRGCQNYSDQASAALSSQRDQSHAARAASFSQYATM